MKPKGSWQYLLVDVDGTLLDSSGRIPPRNRAVLARAVAAGLTLVLATGRTYPSLLRVTDGLQLPFHLITNGGAVGLSPDLAAERHVGYMSRELWPRIVGALQAEGLSTVVYRHRHPAPPRICIASERGDPHFEAYMGRNEQFMELVPDLAAAGFCHVLDVAALGSGCAFGPASARVAKRFGHQSEPPPAYYPTKILMGPVGKSVGFRDSKGPLEASPPPQAAPTKTATSMGTKSTPTTVGRDTLNQLGTFIKRPVSWDWPEGNYTRLHVCLERFRIECMH